MNDETRYHVLKYIEKNPSITQRELAKELGVSVGKANYCLKALIDKGWVKASNFKNSNKKLAYFYILTPSGIEQKAKITVNFLKRKINDYEALKEEIETLKNEINTNELKVDN
ncbi:MAG: MarR family EPS-associated transcriptional regulator [Arenicellales bacterium]